MNIFLYTGIDLNAYISTSHLKTNTLWRIKNILNNQIKNSQIHGS